MQIANRDFSPITQYQERTLKKWLCKRGCYKLFNILDKRYADIWFFANISNPKTIFIGNVYGMEFTVTMNAPYWFSDIKDIMYSLNSNESFTFYVDNDEELPIYPDMVIKPLESGNLVITNISDSVTEKLPLKINNIKTNEVITIKGSYPLVQSSDIVHNSNIYNDINKEWLYLIDGYNTIQTNLSCEINLQYREFRKVGVV